MTVEPPPQLAQELLGLAYVQAVRHAGEAWHARLARRAGAVTA